VNVGLVVGVFIWIRDKDNPQKYVAATTCALAQRVGVAAGEVRIMRSKSPLLPDPGGKRERN